MFEPGEQSTLHPGQRLLDLAWAGGARAVGHSVGGIATGNRADALVLAPDGRSLCSHGEDTALDAWILSATDNPVRDVMVGGRWVVRDGRHPLAEQVLERFRDTMQRLWVEG